MNKFKLMKIYWLIGIFIALVCAIYEFLNHEIYMAGFSGVLGLIATILFINSNEKLNNDIEK